MLGRLCLMVFIEKLESEMRTLGKLRMLRSTLYMLSLPLFSVDYRFSLPHGLIWSSLLCIGVLIILSNTLGCMDLLPWPSRFVGVQVLK